MLHLNVKIGYYKPFNLIAVYRPPTGNLQRSIEVLRQTVEDCVKGDILIIGELM